MFFLLLLFLPFSKGWSSGLCAVERHHAHFAATVLPDEAGAILLPPQGALLTFVHESAGAGTEWVHAKLERKKKSRFLLRHCNFSHHIRKGSNKPFLFQYEPVDDPDHEAAPDESWHTRPRYYIFLFRLSPF